MPTDDKKFIAIVYKRKPCSQCDADAKEGYEPGLFERIDCGCVFGHEIGRYATPSIARLVAAKQSKRTGNRVNGYFTGHWNVETDEDGVIECN